PTLSGELPVKAKCLPFRQIPGTSSLFLDFLSWSPSVQRSFPRSPHFKEWVNEESSRIQYDSLRREHVAGILDRQNRAWGASQRTLENIASLRSGAFATVTGQQVGLYGGPLFSLLKALTAVKLANQAREAGIDAVPIFWLATADHDLAEVN